MSPKNYNFSLIATIVLLVCAYVFTTGYLLTQLTNIDVRTFVWSFSNLKSLYSQHPLISFALGVPAFYCLTVLLSLLIHRRKITTLSSRQYEVLQITSDEQKVLELDASSVVVTVPATSELEPETDRFSVQSNAAGNNTALIERLKKDLVIAEEQLNLSNRAKKNLISNMSHELRTPMNGILGMTELLVGSGLNNQQTGFADSVRRSAEALLGVINDLLDYSRMESGGMYLEKASFNLRDLIEDVCDLKAKEAQIKGLELICHIDRSINDQVIGDANRIRQLLGNLISNGIKFTKEGEVVVKLKQSEMSEGRSVYQIDVVDTGIGISPEGQARIFDSFTQADSSNQREYEGSGLGLFIAHKLVEMMGGKISLRSRMDQGSHFTVTLDLKQAANECESLDLADTLRGVRVLVVDDNETNRTILFHQLRNWGVDAETVESGALALEALHDAHQKNCPFEVAILDLHMPEMDGIELARKIHATAELSGLARMMLTSAALDLNEDELAEIGISQYISKPARQSQLYAALASLIPGSPVRHATNSSHVPHPSFRQLNFHVLLAEDNIINQEVALNMLNNFGCSVEVTNNGQAVLDACAQTRFDLIMMDCVMPVLGGIEATEIIRSSGGINAETPVLALTANVSAEDEQHCLASGMNDYICKPVKQIELYRRLQKWTDQVAENRKKQDAEIAAQIKSTHAEQTPAEDQDDTLGDVNTELSSIEQKGEVTDVATVAASDSQINLIALDNIKKLQRPGKPDLVEKVVGVYLRKSPSLLDEIIQGVSAQDFHRIKEAAHSLKSSSAYVGAEALSDRFRKIELSSDAQNIDEINALVTDLPEAYAQVASQLEMYQDLAA